MSGKGILPQDPRTIEEKMADMLMPSALNVVRHCIQGRESEPEGIPHIDILEYILTGDCVFLDSRLRYCCARIKYRRKIALEKIGEDIDLYLERLETIFKIALRKQINASEEARRKYKEYIEQNRKSLFVDLTDELKEFKNGDETIIEQACDLF